MFSTQWVKIAPMVLCAWLFAVVGAAHGEEVRYEYDASGQLIRMVVPGEGGVRYRHDAAGNIVVVEAAEPGDPPEIDDLDDDRLRCGETREIHMAGNRLEGATLEPSSDDLLVSEFSHTEDGLQFLLEVDCNEAPEEAYIDIVTADGVVTLSLGIDPTKPRILVNPSPLAVGPDGATRSFQFRLSNPDTRSHDFSLEVQDDELAALSSDSLVSLAPGEMGARGSVTGHTLGTTGLSISAPGLDAVTVPVLVTESAAGVNTIVARDLGLKLETEPGGPAELDVTFHGVLGVNVGNGLLGLAPDTVNRGDTEVSLKVDGIGLEAAQELRIFPEEGVEIGELEVSNSALETTISVANDAPVGLRRIEVAHETGTYDVIELGADRLMISHEAPVLTSLDPHRIRIGESSVPFTLRGEHLDGARSIQVEPADGVTVGAPTTSEDGRVVSTQISIDPSVDPGTRTVTVTTPGGESTASSEAAETLYLVEDLGDPVDYMTSASLGVVLEPEEPEDKVEHPDLLGQRLFAPNLGILQGGHLRAIEPSVLVAGEEQTLQLQGEGFREDHQVSLYPGDDVAIAGELEIGSDGQSARISMTVAAEAELGERRLRITDSDGERLPPASAGADLVRITPPGPTIDSVSPIHLQSGAVTPLTIRGAALHDARSVRITPDDNIVLERPVANEEGTSLSARISVGSDAVPGPRHLEVLTPSGIAGEEMTVANTVHIHGDDRETTRAHGVSLGVVLESDASEPPVAPAPGAEITQASKHLGVRVLEQKEQRERTLDFHARSIGVVTGPWVGSIQPEGLLPGENQVVTITGHGLEQVTEIQITPEDQVSLEAYEYDPDSDELRLYVSVPSTVEPGYEQIHLATDSSRVRFANDAQRALFVAPTGPTLDSITPILAGHGDDGEMIIRGQDFHHAAEIVAEPGDGVTFDGDLEINPEGTEIEVGFRIDGDAELGQNVIRVRTRAAKSTQDSSPANTFTIYESVPD